MKEKMMHITDEQMQLYVHNKLSVYERELVELELELCDECLDKFMLYSSELTLPALQVTNEQMNSIEQAISMKQYERKVRWIEHPWAQYVVAASITAIIVSTGILTGVSSKLANLDEGLVKQPSPAVEELKIEQQERHRNSDIWLDKATNVFDKVKQFRFEE